MYKVSINILALCVVMAARTSSIACGPFFPSDVLPSTDEAMLAAPVGDFQFEVARLLPKEVVFKHIEPPARNEWSAWMERRESARSQTEAADIVDVVAALQARGANADTVEMAKQQITALRTVMKPYQLALAKRADAENETYYTATVRNWNDVVEKSGQDPRVAATDKKPPLPDPPAKDAWRELKHCPEEFVLYARGALAFYNRDLKGAREAWEAVLALKPADRRHRSTWAAYMLGRLAMDDDPAAAIAWFKKTRTLAREGFADSTGLAAASLGWEARTELLEGRFEHAFELYLAQTASGDHSGYESLRRSASRALRQEPVVLQRLAADETSQRVMTAALVSQTIEGDVKKMAERWLAAVEKNKLRAPGFDRLAWSAYRAGDFDLARRWLAAADDQSALANWLRAKLALRDGHKKDAALFLAKAVKAFPQDETWVKGQYLNAVSEMSGEGEPPYRPVRQVAGELAVLKLNRGDYAESLSLLLDQEWAADAAYVAEQVMTVDELKKFVESRGDRKTDNAVRALLARALMRAGRWKEAMPFFDDATRKTAEAYVAAIRKGNDKNTANAERITALMEAARLARHEGMSLLATQGPPDHADVAGNYGGDMQVKWTVWSNGKLNAASPDELRRIANVQLPTKRYHYRYVAADHAWAAAALMPDNSQQLAEWLCEAGGWIKHRDPKAADRFYKALVRRCGETELGRQADKLRWFPPTKERENGQK